MNLWRKIWNILSIVGLSLTLIAFLVVSYGAYKDEQRAAKRQEIQRKQ